MLETMVELVRLLPGGTRAGSKRPDPGLGDAVLP